MPAIARGNGVDQVDTVHNATGALCDVAPIVTYTDECSASVFIDGQGVVREGDKVMVHPFPSCETHQPVLVTFSSTVFIDGKGVGRVGDTYGCGAQIITGSSSVFAN